MLRIIYILLSCLLLKHSSVFAGLADALQGTLPPNVTLGMTLSDFKLSRPNAFIGPATGVPGLTLGEKSIKYITFMEVIDIGSIGFSSYWYLVDGQEIVGCLRTRSMVGISPDEAHQKTGDVFSMMVREFGVPQVGKTIRKSETGFVRVCLERWEIPELKGTAYLVATNKEITTGFIKCSSFPLSQVFIKADDERFQFEDEELKSVVDIVRPSINEIVEKKPIRNAELSRADSNRTTSNACNFALWLLGTLALSASVVGVWLFRNSANDKGK